MQQKARPYPWWIVNFARLFVLSVATTILLAFAVYDMAFAGPYVIRPVDPQENSASEPARNSQEMSAIEAEGFVVTPTQGLTTTEWGGTAFFYVHLTSQPTAGVTITLYSSDPSEGVASPSQLVFTSLDWAITQTVTVTGVDDDLADGDVPYTVVLEPAVSPDPAYNGLDPPNVSLTNLDDDTPGFVVTPTQGLVTSEWGDSASFFVRLTSQPTAGVTITLYSSDPSEGVASPSQLEFTSFNWLVTQTVTVTGVDDDLADGDMPYTVVLEPAVSLDPVYNGLDPPNVSLTNLDDDTPGFVVTPTQGLVTSEWGDSAFFYVRLTSQPTAGVTITLYSSDPSEGVASPSQLVFTSLDWAITQTVTVTGVDDDLADGDVPYTVVLEPAVSLDPAYNGLDPPNVSLTNLDDDTPGFVVTPTQGLVTSEWGDSAFFFVRLTSQPTAGVTITLYSSDPSEGVASPSQLEFTSFNWLVTQTVTVTGVDDDLADGDMPYTVVLEPAVSLDPAYNGLDPPNVSLTNLDDDTPGFVVTPTQGLVTSEWGDSAFFYVRLTSQPTAGVTITLYSSDPSEGVASPSQLEFTSFNWLVAQTVTVTGVDDDLADGDVPYTVVLEPAVSLDPAYNGLDPPNVSLTNLDDDTPGILIHPLVITVTEGLAPAFYNLSLSSQPLASVTITFDIDDQIEPISPLIISPQNWREVFTISVTAVDDDLVEGDHDALITHTAASLGEDYDGFSLPSVSVNIRDNDFRIYLPLLPKYYIQAGLLISPSGVLFTAEPDGTAAFSVALNKPPLATVMLTLSSSDPSEGILDIDVMSFTPETWSIPQMVTVIAQDDMEVDGDISYYIMIDAGASNDREFALMPLVLLEVVNLDDDLYYHNFSQPAGWQIFPETGAGVDWISGEMHLWHTIPNRNIRALATYDFPQFPGQYSIQVNLRLAPGDHPGTRAGILFDYADESQFFRFIVSPYEQSWWVFKWQNGWQLLRNGSHSAILPGTATNRLKVVRESGVILVYANGVLVASPIPVDTPLGGRAGLILVAAPDLGGNQTARAIFDNFVISSPP